MGTPRQPYYTNRELVVIALMIALTGVFQSAWSQVVYQIKVLGPVSPFFSGVGFFVWSYVALYLVPKPGTATTVKGLGAIIEVLTGNPFGILAIIYGTLEGLAADIAFVMFGRRLTLNMMVVGLLLTMALTLIPSVYQDGVPWTPEAIIADQISGFIAAPLTGWLCYLVIGAMWRARITTLGASNPYEPQVAAKSEL